MPSTHPSLIFLLDLQNQLLEQERILPPAQRASFNDYKIAYQQRIQSLKQQLAATNNTETRQTNNQHPLKTAASIFKKIADVLDDLWNIVKAALPSSTFLSIGPLLNSTTGFFIHLMEGYDGSNEAHTAYHTPAMTERLARIAAGITTMTFSSMGVLFSILLFIDTVYSTSPANPFLQIAIPGLLTSIYLTSLVRNTYLYFQEKAKATHAATELVSATSACRMKNHNIQSFFALLTSYEQHYIQFEHHQHTYFLSKRKLVLNTIEVIASTIVLVGSALTIPLLLEANIVNLAFNLLVTGVSVGFAGKLFDWYDQKHQFTYSKSMHELHLAPTQHHSTANIHRLLINKQRGQVSSQRKNIDQPFSQPHPTSITYDVIEQNPPVVLRRTNHRAK